MRIADFIINLYGFLYNRNGVPRRFFSPLRYIVRLVANKVLPKLYCKPCFFSKRRVNEKIIVSMTTFPARIDSVWLVIESLLRQTVLPYKIILWLSIDQFNSIECLPESLKKRQNDIFEIKLVENDYRSHKKYLYAFVENPNDIVITVDDDIFYPSTMVETLYKEHLKNPNAVICRYACKIRIGVDGQCLPYEQWSDCYKKNDKDVFFGSGGGTLFVPSMLYKDVTDINLAMKLCPYADDVWLNAMARMNGLAIIPITRFLILPIFSKSKENLKSINVDQGLNDTQINNIMKYYKINIFGG